MTLFHRTADHPNHPYRKPTILFRPKHPTDLPNSSQERTGKAEETKCR